jgi:hypothetical protein
LESYFEAKKTQGLRIIIFGLVFFIAILPWKLLIIGLSINLTQPPPRGSLLESLPLEGGAARKRRKE